MAERETQNAASDPGPTPDALCAECQHHAALHWIGEKCQDCPCERFVPPSNAAFVAESFAPLFGPVDPDYACGAAYCDDPACTTHGRRDDD